MARARRITIPALPHHIIQRGNNRQAVFRDNDDRRVYLQPNKGQTGISSQGMVPSGRSLTRTYGRID